MSDQKFTLGDWEAEVVNVNESALVKIKLTKTVVTHTRFDLGKGIFIDEPYSNFSPREMTPILAHIASLRMEEAYRKTIGDYHKTIEALARENDALVNELAALRNRVGPAPKEAPQEEACWGGCSRGGSGPACGKKGCQG